MTKTGAARPNQMDYALSTFTIDVGKSNWRTPDVVLG